jgi:hypothetical protein
MLEVNGKQESGGIANKNLVKINSKDQCFKNSYAITS